MTYESHTVRSLRRDPIPGEELRLVLTLAADETDAEADETTAEADDGSSASAVSEAVESLGGEVVRELEFDRLLVEVAQTDLDSVVALDRVTAVETDAVLGPT